MGTYVYGFTGSSHPLRIAGMTGVGVDTPPLRGFVASIIGMGLLTA